jgi:predicted RNA-binding Zn ribbon-like protein
MVKMHTAADLPLVGGHLALDFVNTTDEQDPAAEDVLRTPADLRTWGARCGLLSASASLANGASELTRALGLRELLHELLVARINGRQAEPARLAELSALISEAYAAATLQVAGTGRVAWQWPRGELSSVRHAVVTHALELLESEPSERLKECPGERCGWLFLDTSKRGNRRWCSMSECGQDAKDEQRRSRRQAQRQS